MNDGDYGYLKKRVLELASVDLGACKKEQMRGRLESFMVRSGSSNVTEYCWTLEHDGVMLRELLDFL